MHMYGRGSALLCVATVLLTAFLCSNQEEESEQGAIQEAAAPLPDDEELPASAHGAVTQADEGDEDDVFLGTAGAETISAGTRAAETAGQGAAGSAATSIADSLEALRPSAVDEEETTALSSTAVRTGEGATPPPPPWAPSGQQMLHPCWVVHGCPALRIHIDSSVRALLSFHVPTRWIPGQIRSHFKPLCLQTPVGMLAVVQLLCSIAA